MRRLAALAALAVAGCSHPLEIRNLDDYPAAAGEPLERTTTIGMIAQAPDAASRDLVRGIGEALGKYSAQVKTPYAPGAGPPPDAIARVTVTPRYEGSGLNTLVTVPGGLVLAPMWAGYAYDIGYDVQVLLTRGWDNAKIDSWTLPLALDVRHADGPRLGGYDPDVTPEVMAHVREPLGDYVARDIVRRMNQSELLWKLAPPPDTLAARAPEIAPAAAIAQPAPERPSVVARPAPDRATVIAPTAPALAERAPPEVAGEAPATGSAAPRPAPAAPPATQAPTAAPGPLAKGMPARLKPGATVRNRPMPTGQPIDVGRATAAKLGSSIRNDHGTWWYATVAGKSGWVLESELVAAQ